VGFNLTVVHDDQLLGQVQADARTGNFRFVGSLIKTFKDALQIVGFNGVTCVEKTDFHIVGDGGMTKDPMVVLAGQPDQDFTPYGRVFEGVGQDVIDYLVEMPDVNPDIKVFVVAGFQGKTDLLGCGHVFKGQHAVFDELVEVLLNKMQGELPVVQFADIEQLIDRL